MDKYGYVWEMCVACRLYVGLTWMCMKCSQTERPPTVTQIKLDKKNRDFSEFMKINNLESSLFATFCDFFHERHIYIFIINCLLRVVRL